MATLNQSIEDLESRREPRTIRFPYWGYDLPGFLNLR